MKVLIKLSTREQEKQGPSIQPEEIKLLELSKNIIESGWIVTEAVMQDILGLCGFLEIYQKYLHFR